MVLVTMPSLHRSLVALVAALAVSATSLAQSDLSSRVFLYDNSVASNGTANWSVSGSSFSSSATAGAHAANAIISASATGLTVEVNTTIYVRTYFYVNGTFSASFFVRGPGGATSAIFATDIELRVGRPFTVTASGFGPILDSTFAVVSPSVGTAEHRMRLHRNFPGAAGIGTEAIGIDGAFNGATVSCTMDDLPASGVMSLRLRRRLVLNRLALGNETYYSTGALTLSIS